MKVNIGKGIELDVDTSKLNDAVQAHVWYIGLRNILMDAHASATVEEHGDETSAVARAMSEKKLAAMYAGEVRVASTREGDPVRAEAIRIATGQVRAALRKAGRKLSTVDGTALRHAAIAAITPEITALAEKRVADQRALGNDVDVSGLIAA